MVLNKNASVAGTDASLFGWGGEHEIKVPYLTNKNPKKFTLVLDLDETLICFIPNPNEESNSHRKEENTFKELGRFSQPMPYPQKIMNFNLNQSDESNFSPPIGRFSYDCHQFDNKIDNFRGIFNNPLQNQLNFFNNSFSMNGKSGWVCPFCKNFNYESKSYYIIKQFFYKYSKN